MPFNDAKLRRAQGLRDQINFQLNSIYSRLSFCQQMKGKSFVKLANENSLRMRENHYAELSVIHNSEFGKVLVFGKGTRENNDQSHLEMKTNLKNL
jgi:hypothetical protein